MLHLKLVKITLKSVKFTVFLSFWFFETKNNCLQIYLFLLQYDLVSTIFKVYIMGMTEQVDNTLIIRHNKEIVYKFNTHVFKPCKRSATSGRTYWIHGNLWPTTQW